MIMAMTRTITAGLAGGLNAKTVAISATTGAANLEAALDHQHPAGKPLVRRKIVGA